MYVGLDLQEKQGIEKIIDYVKFILTNNPRTIQNYPIGINYDSYDLKNTDSELFILDDIKSTFSRMNIDSSLLSVTSVRINEDKIILNINIQGNHQTLVIKGDL